MQVAEIKLHNFGGIANGKVGISECGFLLTSSTIEKNLLSNAADIFYKSLTQPKNLQHYQRQYAFHSPAWVEFGFRLTTQEHRILTSRYLDAASLFCVHIPLYPASIEAMPRIYQGETVSKIYFLGFDTQPSSQGKMAFVPRLSTTAQPQTHESLSSLWPLLEKAIASLPDPELYADEIFPG